MWLELLKDINGIYGYLIYDVCRRDTFELFSDSVYVKVILL